MSTICCWFIINNTIIFNWLFCYYYWSNDLIVVVFIVIFIMFYFFLIFPCFFVKCPDSCAVISSRWTVYTVALVLSLFLMYFDMIMWPCIDVDESRWCDESYRCVWPVAHFLSFAGTSVVLRDCRRPRSVRVTWDHQQKHGRIWWWRPSNVRRLVLYSCCWRVRCGILLFELKTLSVRDKSID